MDYLQYSYEALANKVKKWNKVLNLIINGLPSIQNLIYHRVSKYSYSFKPYYKWITFNTLIDSFKEAVNTFSEF